VTGGEDRAALPARADEEPPAPAFSLGPRVLASAALAAVVTGFLAFALTMRAPSAWQLLGAGRGLVPEAYYPYSGFVVILATTLGQVVGWAAGSALAAYVLSLVLRRPWSLGLLRIGMGLVYVGLSVLPLGVYHGLFGQPLLGLPREGLEPGLRARYPDAHWLLFTAHPVIDLALLPLGVLVLLTLWRVSDRGLRHPATLFLLVLLVLLTSLAVALSLGIHSVLAHTRF
jgi:hypothetical protein